MTTNTRMATGTFAALLFAAFAQPSIASEPHWSARIGTGQPVSTDSERTQPSAVATQGASASAPWSADIGTGRAATQSRSAPVASSSGVAAPPTHWSARIGTGHALAERKVPAGASRAQVDDTPSLGEHPAALVARSWSTRAIDPNTFIVRHPAGPVWVDASPDSSARALKIASVTE